MNQKSKILWLTDLHLDVTLPWVLPKLVYNINHHNYQGVFLTGDISNGPVLIFHLEFLAKHIKCPIYFVTGNHDFFWFSFEVQKNKIRELCNKYPNLIWLTDRGPLALNDEIAVLGTEGWYDAMFSNPNYLKYTFDWFMIKDFRQLPSMKERIEKFRSLADESCVIIEKQLALALECKFKTIYLLTHVPPWIEATRDEGTLMEQFWLPYNTNLRLGKLIEKMMQGRKKRRLTVLCGHTHTPLYIRVSRNIDCQVGEPHNFFKVNSQIIYI